MGRRWPKRPERIRNQSLPGLSSAARAKLSPDFVEAEGGGGAPEKLSSSAWLATAAARAAYSRIMDLAAGRVADVAGRSGHDHGARRYGPADGLVAGEPADRRAHGHHLILGWRHHLRPRGRHLPVHSDDPRPRREGRPAVAAADRVRGAGRAAAVLLALTGRDIVAALEPGGRGARACAGRRSGRTGRRARQA